MHKPIEIEKLLHSNCIKKTDDDFECERYVDNIFRTLYLIVGDYSRGELRAIADTVLKDV